MAFNYTQLPGKNKRSYNGTGKPLVSIITPYYNAGRYFEETFYAVMGQTFPWFEWIIVDDGSTNEADVVLLKRLAATDSRIRVLRQHNQGPSAARNMAIQQCGTDVVVPLDADDLLEATALETLFWGLYANKDASWCYCDCVGFGNQAYLWRKNFSAETMKRENLLVATAAIRKEALLTVGCYFESDKPLNEDWLLWLTLMGRGCFPVHIKQYGFWYRRHQEGRFSGIQGDSSLKEKDHAIILNAGKQITNADAIRPVEYPRAGKINTFQTTPFVCWEQIRDKSKGIIHITMIFPWLELGGGDLFNLSLARGLDKDRFSVSILTTEVAENTWRDRFTPYTDDIFVLPNFMDTDSMLAYISFHLQTRQTDVLFLSNSFMGYYCAPWIKVHFPHLPIVDYVHMEEWYWKNGGHARTSGRLGGVLEKTYVCNGKTEQVYREVFGREPQTVETVYIGVDAAHFSPAVINAADAASLFDIEAGRPIILFVGRLVPQKRPFLMLAIARRLKEQGSNAAFVVVGDGPQLKEMQTVVQYHHLKNTVYFAGRQDDTRPFYKAASLTLICSIKEGLALTAYESLSTETPVITSDVGGQAELVNDSCGKVIPFHGEEQRDIDARRFEDAEIDAYCKAIKNLLEDKTHYRALCRQSRERILEAFELNHMLAYFNAEFARLAAAKAKPAPNVQWIENTASELAVIAGEYIKLEQSAHGPLAAHGGGAVTASQTYKIIIRLLHFFNHNPFGKVVGKLLSVFKGRQ